MSLSDTASEVNIQQQYYSESAGNYNEMHADNSISLPLLLAAMDFHGIESLLDIGSGTGRVVAYVKEKRPRMKIVGVEPVEALREIGYAQGISRQELIEGDALKLPFKNGEFDMVCEFGMLHHVRQPEVVVAEMLRVAKKAIYIADANNFGQGSFAARSVKQLLNSVGLWKAADLIKTKGKGYTISDGDGLAYSYSVFNNYKQIEKECTRIALLNTAEGRINLYRTAPMSFFWGLNNCPKSP